MGPQRWGRIGRGAIVVGIASLVLAVGIICHKGVAIPQLQKSLKLGVVGLSDTSTPYCCSADCPFVFAQNIADPFQCAPTPLTTVCDSAKTHHCNCTFDSTGQFKSCANVPGY